MASSVGWSCAPRMPRSGAWASQSRRSPRLAWWAFGQPGLFVSSSQVTERLN
jgi:hypothetical protein